jgi:hypothetical protein
MRRVAYVRRGARAGICVLALGVTAAAAQQSPSVNPADQSTGQPAATGIENVTPAEATGTQAPPSAAPTSDLPELVVDGQEKKKKKAAKAKVDPSAAPSTSAAATSEPPPPGVVLGTTAPSDTGTTTFDANAVDLRSNGAGDANSFMRNLPNVQYQNQQGINSGATTQSTIDSKPAQLSISGARTYENNFIVNGVSVNNITGTQERFGTNLEDTQGNMPVYGFYGASSQTIFVPTEFIGEATIVDSNASSEYGQFQGGVVIYDLTAPPTDRYHASVSATKESSDYASYILATPALTNPGNRAAPEYEKNKLSASIGAPITSDFSFVAQVSRLEAESSRPKALWLGPGARTDEFSDNVFSRFAATVRTDIGKFTLDSSRTDYFQRWQQYQSVPGSGELDMETNSSSTKLEHQANLAAVRADAIGLDKVKVKTWAYYNDSVTENNSSSNYEATHMVQRFSHQVGGAWTQTDYFMPIDGCPGSDRSLNPPATPTTAVGSSSCYSGGFGNLSSSQTDYGVQSIVDGKLLLGGFKAGAEIKHYDAARMRPEDAWIATGGVVLWNRNVYTGNSAAVAPVSFDKFICPPGDQFCDETQFSSGPSVSPKFSATAQVNALHTFAEIDQTLAWFNLRAGVRLDYDDYQKNYNVAPRLAATVKPFDGISITGGFNQYYLGETLYYAMRDKMPDTVSYVRTYCRDVGDPNYDPTCAPGTVGAPEQEDPEAYYHYNMGALETPYDDEYTAAVGIKDPFLEGQWRLKYLQRYGREQFATVACPGGVLNCWTATNDGESAYRSASAEYTKEWSGLQNALSLNAAAITGNVTWSERSVAGSTYLVKADIRSDGTEDLSRIWYNGKSYRPEEFDAVTGNFDIPVRFGATVATLWFNGALELGASAGVNLGYEAARYLNRSEQHLNPETNRNSSHQVWQDAKLKPTLKLDISGKLNVTEQAYVEFLAGNVTNSDQNLNAAVGNPWVLGRTFWVGSGLRF